MLCLAIFLTTSAECVFNSLGHLAIFPKRGWYWGCCNHISMVVCKGHVLQPLALPKTGYDPFDSEDITV